jgi:hypothetical protein
MAKICKNPQCDSHKFGWTFTVSTAEDENSYCSSTCENQALGKEIATDKRKRGQ